MALDMAEREILAQLIRAVQTLAQQLPIVHLQLGAVRSILARKGTITADGVQSSSEAARYNEFDWGTARHSTDYREFFVDLLRRLEQMDDGDLPWNPALS